VRVAVAVVVLVSTLVDVAVPDVPLAVVRTVVLIVTVLDVLVLVKQKPKCWQQYVALASDQPVSIRACPA
jgi:hypothetical protein